MSSRLKVVGLGGSLTQHSNSLAALKTASLFCGFAASGQQGERRGRGAGGTAGRFAQLASVRRPRAVLDVAQSDCGERGPDALAESPHS